jgi:hypothetical protein
MGESFRMKVYYLEIVASDEDAVCAAYEATHGIKFGSAEPLLETEGLERLHTSGFRRFSAIAVRRSASGGREDASVSFQPLCA